MNCRRWKSTDRTALAVRQSSDDVTNSTLYRLFYYFLRQHCKSSQSFDEHDLLTQMEECCLKFGLDFSPLRKFYLSKDEEYVQQVISRILNDNVQPVTRTLNLPLPETRLRRDFDILEKVGKGGFGVVYKVQHRLDKNIYAIKQMPIDISSPESQKMIREAELGTKFIHSNIIRYVTSWIDTEVEERKPIITEVQSESSIAPPSVQKPFLHSEQKSINFNSNEVIYEWKGSSDSMESSTSNSSSSEDEIYSLSDKSSNELIPYKAASPPLLASRNSRRNSRKRTSSDIIENFNLCIQMDYCTYSLRFYMDVRNSIILKCPVQDTIPIEEYAKNYKDEFINRSIPEYLSDTFKIAVHILNGIQYLHDNHVIHRDIKPENILWCQKARQWQICDFGLAREVHQPGFGNSELARAIHDVLSTGLGTLHYSAPEQRSSSKYTFSVDIYACGYLLLEVYYPMSSLSERVRLFDIVRKETLLPSDFESKQKTYLSPSKAKSISIAIKSMIEKDPDIRPSAISILKSKVFECEESGISEVENEIKKRDLIIENQKRELEQKDREIRKLKQQISKLIFKQTEQNENGYRSDIEN